MVFGLGMQRGGVVGAFLASLGFTMPSAVLMILFACGVAAIGDLSHADWLHGLKLAAVAVVAQAVWGMGTKLCPDRARLTLALGGAAVLLLVPGAVAQIGVIAVGALIGWALSRREAPVTSESSAGLARHHLWAAGILVTCGALLFVLPVMAATTGQK